MSDSDIYLAPQIFLGKKEVLGEIEFSTSIDIVYLDETKIIFSSKAHLAKGADVVIALEDFRLQVKVHGIQSGRDNKDSITIEAKIESSDPEVCLQLRQYLFRLMKLSQPAQKAA